MFPLSERSLIILCIITSINFLFITWYGLRYDKEFGKTDVYKTLHRFTFVTSVVVGAYALIIRTGIIR